MAKKIQSRFLKAIVVGGGGLWSEVAVEIGPGVGPGVGLGVEIGGLGIEPGVGSIFIAYSSGTLYQEVM